MAQVKERGGGGEERKETLADKPLDFENRPLGLPVCPSVERKWTLEARVWNQNNFFWILQRVDGVNGEIPMNPNDQCRPKLSQTEQLTVLATAQTTRVLL